MEKLCWKLINNQQGIPHIAGSMPFSEMIKFKLKLFKICRTKSLKSINFI